MPIVNVCLAVICAESSSMATWKHWMQIHFPANKTPLRWTISMQSGHMRAVGLGLPREKRPRASRRRCVSSAQRRMTLRRGLRAAGATEPLAMAMGDLDTMAMSRAFVLGTRFAG